MEISQGSVAVHLRCGGLFHTNFIANLVVSPSVKEFWKLISIWRRYGQKSGVFVFFYSQYRCNQKPIVSFINIHNNHEQQNSNYNRWHVMLAVIKQTINTESTAETWCSKRSLRPVKSYFNIPLQHTTKYRNIQKSTVRNLHTIHTYKTPATTLLVQAYRWQTVPERGVVTSCDPF